MPNRPVDPNDPPNPPDVTVESVFGAQAGNPPIIEEENPSQAEVELAAEPSEVEPPAPPPPLGNA
jgi:hypothetical protein